MANKVTQIAIKLVAQTTVTLRWLNIVALGEEAQSEFSKLIKESSFQNKCFCLNIYNRGVKWKLIKIPKNLEKKYNQVRIVYKILVYFDILMTLDFFMKESKSSQQKKHNA